MPLCIEAIEMKHIVMKKPPFSGSLRHNSKGFFSIILLAICDACYNFTAIDVEQYGSKNDSAVLLNSKMKKKKKKEKNEKDSFYVPAPEKTHDAWPLFLVGEQIFQLMHRGCF